MNDEWYVAAHEALIEEYMEEHPEATDDEAYEATADRAYDRMRDMAQHAADSYYEGDR